ncbi:hypothetical protein BKA70DRAFT_501476 [Coprinopsis sp. MPI-PUGE-AT-0042]|nr:hypothetical protein BKA70DRAFT_501476 [Coprinopsis sp. MPI-PUGE-AT-0042]
MQKLTENVTTAYVLDALDEAPVSIQLDLVKKLASLKCKVFITSRPLKAVEVHFPAAHCFSIVAQAQTSTSLLNRSSRRVPICRNFLRKEQSPLRDEIVTSIKMKCGWDVSSCTHPCSWMLQANVFAFMK